MVIVGGHLVVQFLPSSVSYLALIPARYFLSSNYAINRILSVNYSSFDQI